MHRRISETSSSARSASAHAVQLRAQSKHSAMQRASASRSTSLGFGWVASSSATLVAVAMTPPPSGLPARTADGPSYPACSCSTKTEAPAAGVIPGDDVERVIEGVQQVQREHAGFREQIPTKRLGAPLGSGVKESDDDRREDE
jgi:hypothetical protein